MKVRFTSGITKYLLDDETRSSTTYSGITKRGCLILDLEPFCIYIRQECKPPETETDETKTHKACHSSETGALIIPKAEMLFCIPDAQLNGLITNDKFCLTRYGKLQLSWWRRPLRLRS